jgi:hypothetical protein
MALLVAQAVSAQDAETTTEQEPDMSGVIREAGDATLEDFIWVKRPVIVFADSPADPRFVQQMQFIERDLDRLVDRDVIVLTDTDPRSLSPLRKKLRPRGFMLVLVGKDGDVELRKPLPWSVRELSRTIDKMPTRQQEIRDQGRIGGGS